MSRVEWSLSIGGDAVAGATTLPVTNPATGEVLAEAPAADAAQLDAAFAAAAGALPGWSATDPDERGAALLAAADAVAAATDELAALITDEQGKPLPEATVEVLGTVAALRHFAGLRIADQVLRDAAPRVVVRRRPVGVVGAITPWNSPVMVAGGMKIAPALAAGATVVLKPSPFTPLSSLRLAELMTPALPPGVLNVVSGANDLGAWMTAHPIPRLITFTGSPAIGRRVAAAAAEDLKRVVLELGGNDPAVLLDDAVVADVAEAVFWAAFGNAGQTCVAVKRVYVPEALHAELVDALVALAEGVLVGGGREDGVRMGPLTSPAQRDIVAGLVEDARSSGGRVVTGGEVIDRPGNFYRPTIVDGVTDKTRLVAEEQFGPALPIVAYRDLDEVLGNVNASDYGLGGSVWGTDVDRARSVADRVEAGTTWVNTHRGSLWPLQPTAGLKQSGLGAELGTWGLESFTELSVAHDVRTVTARPVGLVTGD